MVDARLPDGSRVNAIIPPLALRGPTLTIRKFSRDPYTMDDLISFGSISPKAAQFLAACAKGKLNVLISGGTGTGKTTTLNAISAFVPGDERIVTIEDAAELQLQQEHVITLEARPPNIEGQGEIRIRELVRNALRMRPDRIIVGEVRGAETLDMLQAMNTGHDGSLTTIHANSPRDALSRLETLVLTAGVELPLRAIREQIASAFDLLVQITRLVDGSRRVTHVTEVLRMESDVITLQDIFHAKPPTRRHGVRRRDEPAARRSRAPASSRTSSRSWRPRRRPAAELLRRGSPATRSNLRRRELRGLLMRRARPRSLSQRRSRLAVPAANAGVAVKSRRHERVPEIRVSVVTSEPSPQTPGLTENGRPVSVDGRREPRRGEVRRARDRPLALDARRSRSPTRSRPRGASSPAKPADGQDRRDRLRPKPSAPDRLLAGDERRRQRPAHDPGRARPGHGALRRARRARRTRSRRRRSRAA